jgi:hypothetical protein
LVLGRHYWPSDLVVRANGGGEWGVKRGECGAVFGRGGDTRAVRTLEAAMAVFGQLGPEEEEVGRGPRGSERRGWKRAGLVGGQGLVGREAGGWAWEKEATQERRRACGPGRRERSGPGRGDGERADRRPRPRQLGRKSEVGPSSKRNSF